MGKAKVKNQRSYLPVSYFIEILKGEAPLCEFYYGETPDSADLEKVPRDEFKENFSEMREALLAKGAENKLRSAYNREFRLWGFEPTKEERKAKWKRKEKGN